MSHVHDIQQCCELMKTAVAMSFMFILVCAFSLLLDVFSVEE